LHLSWLSFATLVSLLFLFYLCHTCCTYFPSLIPAQFIPLIQASWGIGVEAGQDNPSLINRNTNLH
jgi:hypothetical protein